MTKIIAEYIWIDALGDLRSKTKIFDLDSKHIVLNDFPIWSFDGSSTGQSSGRASDVLLKPINIFNDPFRKNLTNAKSFLILCETLKTDGTPHPTNTRDECMKICHRTESFKPWFGIEQEYYIYELCNDSNIKSGEKPLGWKTDTQPNNKFPHQEQQHKLFSPVCKSGIKPFQCGPSYCGVGGDRVDNRLREIIEKHIEYCLYAEIKICGTNLEVSKSQAEYQIGICTAEEIGDHLWIARYIMNRICEQHGVHVNLHPKPILDTKEYAFNGSGGHVNFSTLEMRNDQNKILEACELLSKKHIEHMNEYGVPEENAKRMSGNYETSKFDKFSFDINTPYNRGQSLRLPPTGGYLEDRRPASDSDPYRVVVRMLKTICLKE